jgi:hypothetical protein
VPWTRAGHCVPCTRAGVRHLHYSPEPLISFFFRKLRRFASRIRVERQTTWLALRRTVEASTLRKTILRGKG